MSIRFRRRACFWFGVGMNFLYLRIELLSLLALLSAKVQILTPLLVQKYLFSLLLLLAKLRENGFAQ